MAIVQISKMIQRSGNIVDLLPGVLSEAELGFATDANRVFIGSNGGGNIVEVLTSYSNISFGQITGAGGIGLNILGPAQDGQILAYDAATGDWTNRGNAAGGLVDLGDASNIRIGQGAIGYVLETDGYGNVSWTSKGTITAPILAISSAVPGIMTVNPQIPYVNFNEITISGVAGTNANALVNGQSFFIKVAVDYPTSGNVELYQDALCTVPVDTSTLSATPLTGQAVSRVGSLANFAGGSNTSVQFNNSGILDGAANFKYDPLTSNLSLTGNATITGNTTTGNLSVLGTSAFGNITVTGNMSAANFVGGNYSGANMTLTGNIGAGNISATGNITAANFVGNFSGNFLAPGVNTEVIFNNAGNLGADAGFTYNLTTDTVTVVGNVNSGNTVTGIANIATANISTALIVGGTSNLGPVTNVTITGGSAGQSLTTDGLGVLSWASPSRIQNTANTTSMDASTGLITGNWTLAAASTIQATYADIAEAYESDRLYEPGTVVAIGGTREITEATLETASKTVGVVTTRPAYVLNSLAQHSVNVALIGRIPCRVIGRIYRGDLLTVSAIPGVACASTIPPVYGTIIGRALEDYHSDAVGRIEIKVDRG